jgi:hypothetical protein
MSLVFQNIDPPSPSPPGECVLCCGGRTDSPGGEGDVGSIFWKTREIGLPSYNDLSTGLMQLSENRHCHSKCVFSIDNRIFSSRRKIYAALKYVFAFSEIYWSVCKEILKYYRRVPICDFEEVSCRYIIPICFHPNGIAHRRTTLEIQKQ